MFNYKGVGFTAEKQDELDRQTKAIDSKTIVEYQGVGPSGPATITFDGTTGQKTFSAPKPEESQLTASSATPPAAAASSVEAKALLWLHGRAQGEHDPHLGCEQHQRK